MKKSKAKKIFRLLNKISKLMSGDGCPLKRAGKLWERRCAAIAACEGLAVSAVENRSAKYDLLINGLRVQCKKRTLLPSGKVKLCFCARKASGAKKEAYLVGEFDVLCMRCSGLVYVIPASALESGDGSTLRNEIDPSAYAAYVDNWGFFRGAGAALPARQMAFEFTSQGKDASRARQNPRP